MPKIDYTGKVITGARREMVRVAERICAELAADGYDLTLRQLYYQFVAHDLFPDDRTWRQVGKRWVRDPNGTKNAEPNYTWLGGIVNDARMAGYLDWAYLVDRTRAPSGGTGSMTDPAEVINPNCYWIDKWKGQEYYVETWVEKEALAGVLQRACPLFEITHFCCRGYVSQSAQWRAARRMREAIDDGKKVRILHLGDHDPSGIDMTRDIRERLATFIAQDLGLTDPGDEASTAEYELDERFDVERLALNMDQIRQYDPPPNLAKLTDSRGSSYVRRYGNSSWELDALGPRELVPLIQDAIGRYVDQDLFDQRVALEREERKILAVTKDHWDEISAHVRERWPTELERGKEDE